jgi:KaiC/GvpD/RAD55 family RecA-like ATPase
VAGSGKTTFGMQFLHNGITQFNENGIFVTLEEEVPDLTKDMGRYGWDLEGLIAQKRLAIIRSPIPFEVTAEAVSMDVLLDAIHKNAAEIDAKRLVFDSIAALGLPYGDTLALRRDILRLCALLRELGCTTLLMTEMESVESKVTRYGIEEFVAQGLMILHLSCTYRGIQIRKMRGTKHDTTIHTLRLSDRGIVVSPGEHPL